MLYYINKILSVQIQILIYTSKVNKQTPGTKLEQFLDILFTSLQIILNAVSYASCLYTDLWFWHITVHHNGEITTTIYRNLYT